MHSMMMNVNAIPPGLGYSRTVSAASQVQPVTSITATQQEGYQRSYKMKTYEDLKEDTKRFALQQIRTGSTMGEVVCSFEEIINEIRKTSDYVEAMQDANRRP
jgi:cytosine/adenosine deaminase-related metal-dependent hydrolase